MRVILNRQRSVALLLSLAIFQMACPGRRTNPATTPQITSASFISIDKVWLTTFNKGKILRSLDGGVTWSDVSIKGTRVDYVAFIDENYGWAVSAQGEVFKTEDSGNHWTDIGTIPESREFHYAGASQLSFTNETEGWMVDASSVWCTADGGKNWSRCFPISSDGQDTASPMSYFRTDAMTAWVAATDGELFRTTDGGQSWQRSNLRSTADFTTIYFFDQKVGWVAGSPKAGIFATTDGGETWVIQTDETAGNIDVESFDFVSKQEGWAVGRVWPPDVTRSNTRSVVLHTVDGGQHWEESHVGEDELFFTQVRFPTASNGWTVGRDTLYRTANGGKNWRNVFTLDPSN